MNKRPHSAQPRITSDLHAKSLLQSRNIDRLAGSSFFQDNKIKTCSYIIQNGDNFTAVPFYDKRNKK